MTPAPAAVSVETEGFTARGSDRPPHVCPALCGGLLAGAQVSGAAAGAPSPSAEGGPYPNGRDRRGSSPCSLQRREGPQAAPHSAPPPLAPEVCLPRFWASSAPSCPPAGPLRRPPRPAAPPFVQFCLFLFHGMDRGGGGGSAGPGHHTPAGPPPARCLSWPARGQRCVQRGPGLAVPSGILRRAAGSPGRRLVWCQAPRGCAGPGLGQEWVRGSSVTAADSGLSDAECGQG